MINDIYFMDIKVSHIQKEGKYNYIVMEDGSRFPRSSFKHNIQIQCHECNKLITKKFDWYSDKKVYICQSCGKIGERNGFYHKKHTQEFKDKLSNDRKGWTCTNSKPVYQCWLEKYGKEEADKRLIEYKQLQSEIHSGENNPFYGKSHTQETKQKIIEGNRIYKENLTVEEKQIISHNLSNAQKRLYAENPERYIDNKKKAARFSHILQSKYKMNKIESIVNDELIVNNLDFQYSVILGYKQYDFGSREHRILLEVQGDYWHCNPKLYDRNNISLLTEHQITNMEKDIIKYNFAIKHNMKIFYIWESDILAKDFTTILDIKDYIYGKV